MDIKQEFIVFRVKDNSIDIDVKLDRDTIWLNLNQLSQLFERDKSVISKHLNNIFKDQELEKKSTIAKFATVQKEGKREVEREIDYYNLDVIISVGYRVNSKRGIEFRKWTSNVLKDHLIKGFSINHKRIAEKGLIDLRKVIELVESTLKKNELINDIGSGAIEVINQYAKTWSMLLFYDEDSLLLPNTLVDSNATISYKNVVTVIESFKRELLDKGEATNFFGQERDSQLQGIFGTIHQTFDQLLLYPSIEERAAHLLYFIIKDHPFVDGNKRIGSLLFIIYLKSQKINSKVILGDSTMIALALLVAESNPLDKELIIRLIINLIVNND